MIEELGDLYAFPRTVITPLPQVKLDSMIASFLKTLMGSVPEQDTSASTNLFYCETSKSSSSFFFFFMKWEKEIKKLEKVEDREIKSV